MKNLLVYMNLKKKFEGEEKIAIKIQIDNSLGLGWKKEDILLVTNFPYKYRGIESFIMGDDAYCTYFPRCSKWGTIIKLFEKYLINENTLYWYHDLDAYQLGVINESEIPMSDMALCDYGAGKYLWSGGSIFFRNSAKDIFTITKELMDQYKTRNDGVECDEVALFKITHRRRDIKPRVKKLNISYNFHGRNVKINYPVAIKPIKVAHFHFSNLTLRPNYAHIFLHSQKILGVQIVPDRLIKIFTKYGIT